MNKNQHYDQALKHLFSFGPMIASLLKGLVKESWVASLDFSTLEKFNIEHITDDLRTRRNDLVWKVRAKGKWLYLLFLLEFQSTTEYYMAVRLLTYSGLIYQDWIKTRHRNQHGKNLPPIFSLVLYTGDNAWKSPLAMRDCYSEAIPSALLKYQPDMQYVILDVSKMKLAEYNLDKDNLVLPLLQFEKARSLADMQLAMNSIVKVFASVLNKTDNKDQIHSLRRAYLVYIAKALKMPEKYPNINLAVLEEGKMLQSLADRWEQYARAEGKAEGKAEGISNLLIQQMEIKFGPMSISMRESLKQAPIEQLVDMGARIITATHIEEVFAEQLTI